ncbi:hypothetical protein ANRL3_01289 [Anaerolineae bacterium]|nr:hypothetical protein ANRL3_01289 [Anaerolineae bacterium]
MTEISELTKQRDGLKDEIAQMKKQLDALRRHASALNSEVESSQPTPSLDLEAIYVSIVKRLEADPKMIRLIQQQPRIEVEVRYETIAMTNKTLIGRLAQMIAEGFFDEPKNGQAAFNELWGRLNFPQAKAKPNVYRELDKLVALGFLTKEPAGYRAVPTMKVNITKGE